MARRARIISEEALGPDSEGHEQFLVTEVHYDLGGMDYGTYRNKPRGYYLSVYPEGRFTTDSGHPMRSFGLFSGIKTCIQPAKAFSRKVLDAIQPDPAMIAELREQVLAKQRKSA